MSFKPLWPGDAAALLQARGARRQIELVVDHQHLGGLDPEEARHHLHRPAARVHVALRQHQPRPARLVAADQRLELAVLAQHRAALRGQPLDEPEARVVPGGGVLVARIAEADDQFHDS